ncbi:hypothetical protein K443DRAFT_1321 [Laccaria amethystina LaAM-08-1]|uniref:Uncharacterized protein n=1 Tax=Laccaria amethystina LaAM-08-1 TaxID=1095629 RepID=A0A0C9YKR6_9AGAR|nr:hypothetical protein K443DRAFT_1321 [Laccaria amethystina LaAM-08-1]
MPPNTEHFRILLKLIVPAICLLQGRILAPSSPHALMAVIHLAMINSCSKRMNWTSKVRMLFHTLYLSNLFLRSPHEATPIGSRVSEVANSLTVSVRKPWAVSGPTMEGEATPPGHDSRLTRAMKACHPANALDAADLSDWLFTEQERCIGGLLAWPKSIATITIPLSLPFTNL